MTNSSVAHNAPAITRPCPSKNFVPECITMSAPKVSGRCSAGVAKQLSTANNAPARCAKSASAAMSHTSVSGFVGVSANSNLVFGRIAAFHSSTLVCETKVDCTPNFAKSEPMSLIVEPNMLREHTTWSPACSKPKHIIKIADMPDAVEIAASAPSILAKRCSKLATVGLP